MFRASPYTHFYSVRFSSRSASFAFLAVRKSSFMAFELDELALFDTECVQLRLWFAAKPVCLWWLRCSLPASPRLLAFMVKFPVLNFTFQGHASASEESSRLQIEGDHNSPIGSVGPYEQGVSDLTDEAVGPKIRKCFFALWAMSQLQNFQFQCALTGSFSLHLVPFTHAHYLFSCKAHSWAPVLVSWLSQEKRNHGDSFAFPSTHKFALRADLIVLRRSKAVNRSLFPFDPTPHLHPCIRAYPPTGKRGQRFQAKISLLPKLPLGK